MTMQEPAAHRRPLSMIRALHGAHTAHYAAEDAAGEITRLGLPRGAFRDYYHQALTISNGRFFCMACAVYLAINLLFALFYMWAPDQISNLQPHNFSDAFFFSVQTISTVGFGAMAPTGSYVNSVVTVEVFVGMAVNAVATGLLFARFSRPRAKLRFAKQALMTHADSKLSIRIANLRHTGILSADVQLSLSLLHTLEGGQLIRTFDELPLLQSHLGVLRCLFVLHHLIDEHSPLYGLGMEQLQQQQAELILIVAGIDELTSQTIYSQKIYRFEQLDYGKIYADIVQVDKQGHIFVDFAHFDDIWLEQDSTPSH